MAGSLSDKPAVDLAREFVSAFRGFFGDRVGRFSVKDIVDGDGHTEFSVLFDIYAFFPLRFNFDRGAFGFSIDYGERGISVEPVTGWPEFTDMTRTDFALDCDSKRLAVMHRGHIALYDFADMREIRRFPVDHVVRTAHIAWTGDNAISVRTDYGCLSTYAI